MPHFISFARLLFLFFLLFLLFFLFPAGIQMLFGLFAQALCLKRRAFALLVGHRIASDHFHRLAAIGAGFGLDERSSVRQTALVGIGHGGRGHEEQRQ